MVRRGQQERRAMRQASKDATAQLDSPHGSYTPPDRDACLFKNWATVVDDGGTVQLQFNLWRHQGKLVDFVVLVQRLTPDGWKSVERFDCCHGHCHLHVDNDETDVRSIQRLDARADIDDAFIAVNKQADERARIIRDKE